MELVYVTFSKILYKESVLLCSSCMSASFYTLSLDQPFDSLSLVLLEVFSGLKEVFYFHYHWMLAWCNGLLSSL